MVTFNDIFKSDFLSSTNLNTFSVLDVVLALALAFVLGLFIYLTYKKTYKGVMYSSAFGVSLIAMSMITTLVILAITTNIVLSLGMVGALSIVRFRAAIKEPMDIAFLFWSIAAGIVLGAGLIPLAVIGSAIIGVVILLCANIKTAGSIPYILVVNCAAGAEHTVVSVIDAASRKSLLKSKTVSKKGLELTYEVRLKEKDAHTVNKLLSVSGVYNAVLVSYNGEYMS